MEVKENKISKGEIVWEIFKQIFTWGIGSILILCGILMCFIGYKIEASYPINLELGMPMIAVGSLIYISESVTNKVLKYLKWKKQNAK